MAAAVLLRTLRVRALTAVATLITLSVLLFVAALGLSALANRSMDAIRHTALAQYGEATVVLVEKWLVLIDRIQPLSDQEKLRQTNNFFNSASGNRTKTINTRVMCYINYGFIYI